MANPEHVERLKEGVEQWNEWRRNNPSIEIDLSEEQLGGPYLGPKYRRQKWPDLSRADFSRANLNGADLSGCSLVEANFLSAQIRLADFSGVGAPGAIFRGADLRHANLRGAVLDEADFSSAVFAGTTFTFTNLSRTKGLQFCVHKGPSSAGIDTLVKSNGEIPESFLRGCGVPEKFITYARSLFGQPIEFYSCFISYSSQDQEFAERLHTDLVAKNLRCWFGPEDLKIGDRFEEHIEASIKLFDKVMIVLSENSVRSEWVAREVRAAREREDRENRAVLFPIRIDEAVMDAHQPWAADIRRSRHIGNFGNWKDHDSYKKGFDRLLRDLQAKGDKPKPGK